MRANYFKAAEVINQAYNVESSFDSAKRYDLMVVYDDDITAVLRSMNVYRQIKQKNPAARLVVVGGEGLLQIAFTVMRLSLKIRGNRFASHVLQKETEAARLKRVAIALGVKETEIDVLDKGHNTTENLQAVSQYAKGKKVLVVSTQRLAMIFKQSADFQCNTEPQKHRCCFLDYDLYVIHQSVTDTLHWYNFQIAGNGRVSLHLFASLVRRFDVYDGKFLRKPFEADLQTKEADLLLRKRFLIKQRVSGLKKIRVYFQYIPIIWDIFRHAEEYLFDEINAIENAEHL